MDWFQLPIHENLLLFFSVIPLEIKYLKTVSWIVSPWTLRIFHYFY